MGGPDSDAPFRTLFEPHRRAITLHCYRMLGSLQDAEEIAQESLLRAWQRRAESRATDALRAWLYKIATNACLDHLSKVRRRRSLPHLIGPARGSVVRFGPALDPGHWVEPAPDALWDLPGAVLRPDEQMSQRQSVRLAFIAALQLLSPKQRAALLLIDVLGMNPEEVAGLLTTSVVSINSLLQRARKNVEGSSGEDPDAHRPDADLLQRFITTWESGDLEAFTALLAEDALLSMPPQPEWFAGRAVIREFFAAIWAAAPGQRRLTPLSANGEQAVAVYRRPLEEGAVFEASGITILRVGQGRVLSMTRFDFPKLFPLFGLPLQLVPRM